MNQVWRPAFILPPLKILIVKYLSEAVDYKQYCDRGKGNVIYKPQECPFCKRKNCLKGHGWYSRKGLSGHPAGYLSFPIKRFRCSVTGKTISIHPTFSQTRKRYTLQTALDATDLLSDQDTSITATAKRLCINRSNVSRWRRGFLLASEAAKWACFYHGDLPRPLTLKELLFSAFDCCIAKAAQGMACLKDLFRSDLY